jgi:hypothetical protein|tara:strand:+ start:1276 stop:2160 length:885 start_codon:yes stop_codon:yes gene_type:complete
MNQVAINTNFSDMAKLMGMSVDNQQTEKASTLARLRISHAPIMGEAEVNGKTKKVEVVEGGTYRLEIPDGPTYYASKAVIRPFVQRFMYKRFVKGNDSTPNRYIKTVMADNLNIDLKDNDGGFNCGKPAGYIQDFKALPESMQDLIKQIKRVRVVFGTVELIDPVDAAGKAVDLSSTPFIWEVENRDAFKSIGALFTKLGKMRRLPPQHTFTATTAEQSLPNGSSFYLPETALDLQTTLELDDAAQETLGNFLAWVTNYNEYISNAWDENAHKHEDVDKEGVEEFIDITEEDFA